MESKIHKIGVFLFAFLFICIYFLGLPIDFNADFLRTHIRATSLSYTDLIKYTVNPTTPAWFYPETIYMEYLRPMQVVLFNVVFHFFPYSNAAFQFLAAIGHGLLAVLFFMLITRWTRSVLLAWLMIILYASFPSNYFMLSSINTADFQYYLSIMIISSLLIFGQLTLGKLSGWRFLVGIVCWVLLIWLSIKLKSTEKIMPFIFIAFLTLFFRRIVSKIGIAKYTTLMLVCFCMMVLVVPFKTFDYWKSKDQVSKTENTLTIQPRTKKDKKTFSFSLNHLLQRTFYVSEKPPIDNLSRSFTENLGFNFLKPLGKQLEKDAEKREWADLLKTRNFGFPLGWFFWISLSITATILLHKRVPEIASGAYPSESFIHFFWLFLIWFGATVAGFASGVDLTEIRLLNFAYVPAVILLPMSTHVIETHFFNSTRKRLWFRLIFSSFVIWTCVTNFGLLNKLIRDFGGMQDTLVRIERDVYQAVYREAPDPEHLYHRHKDLEGEAVFVEWYEHSADWLESIQAKFKKQNQLFFFTRNPETERLKNLQDAGYVVELWKEYDLLDSRPFVFRIFKQMIRLKPKAKKRAIWVYLIKPKMISVA